MCQFKSGIILKTRVVIAEGADDSHSKLLEELGIEDTYENAVEKFVRVELLPPQNEWWTDPETWIFHADQDIVPDWFDIDREKYIKDFREAVKEWWKEHVRVDQTIDELTSGYYRLKRCEVKKLLKDVQVMCDNSVVQDMYGNSVVQDMYDSSVVQNMHDNSVVRNMCDSSVVRNMYSSSVVRNMYDSSVVQNMHSNSVVQDMCGSSVVQNMYDSSIARDYSRGIIHISDETKLKVEMHKNKPEEQEE